MKIETKFNLRDFVYPISMGGYEQFIKCEICNGLGEVTIAETSKKIKCPDCYGRRGSRKWKRDKWIVEERSGNIGKISAEIYDGVGENKYSYMLDSTGIGSGTVWHEDRLFLTLKDAQRECNKRNKNDLKTK